MRLTMSTVLAAFRKHVTGRTLDAAMADEETRAAWWVALCNSDPKTCRQLAALATQAEPIAAQRRQA